MIGFLGDAYLWVKALHILFVIFWMAGLFMLPRYFVYHQECEAGSPEIARWVDRESRLIRIILNPAMVIVWLCGFLLNLNMGVYAEGWFTAKYAVAVLLTGYHGWMVRYAGRLVSGEGERLSGRTLRLLNEVPGLAAAVIVILVIVRPF